MISERDFPINKIDKWTKLEGQGYIVDTLIAQMFLNHFSNRFGEELTYLRGKIAKRQISLITDSEEKDIF